MSDLSEGDYVRFVGGGPIMKVSSVDPEYGVACSWFCKLDQFHNLCFGEKDLIRQEMASITIKYPIDPKLS